MSSALPRVRLDPDLTRRVTARGVGLPSFFPALILFGAASIILGLSNDKLGWELLSVVTVSAAFGAADVFDVTRRRREMFSPRALVSLLIINAVYVSPILLIVLEFMPRYLVLPVSMEAALFDLALFHLLGVGVYFTSVRIMDRTRTIQPGVEKYTLESSGFIGRIRKWSMTFAVLSLTVFGYIVLSSGGPLAWINAQLNYRTELTTPGWMLAVSTAFPTLFFLAYVVKLKLGQLKFSRAQVRKRVVIALLVLVAVTLVTNGLRGSRANLIWPTLTAIIVVHLMLFRIKAKWIAVIAVLALVFVGVYDVYKKAGTDGIAQLQAGTFDDAESYSELGFGPQAMLLGDFSRSAMQAILLDRWNSTEFERNWGKTYVGDAIQFVPGAGSSNVFPNKRYASTEILYGPGSSEIRNELSTRIFGLQGEALMNFGPAGAVLIFVPYAYFMSLAERSYSRARYRRSVRSAVIAAVLVPVVILMFLSDMDNVVSAFTSKAMFPLLAIGLASLSGAGRPIRRPSLARMTRFL